MTSPGNYSRESRHTCVKNRPSVSGIA